MPLFGFPLFVRRNVEMKKKNTARERKEPEGGSVDGELVVPLMLDAA